MTQPRDDGRLLRFDFSTYEGHELATLLENLLFSAQQGVDMAVLETVYERLSDETFLALWKREDVSIDLSMDELMELNKAVRLVGGSAALRRFHLTGELPCCLIAHPSVDRMYRTSREP